MAEAVREEAKSRRAGARERRRSSSDQPVEPGEQGETDPMATAKRAARTAAAAAIAGGLAGAAKALVSRPGRSHDDEDAAEDEPRDEQSPQHEDVEQQDEDVEQEQPEDLEQEQPEDAHPAEDEPGREQREPEQKQREPKQEQSDPEHGAPSSEVASLVDQARSHVESLLGKEAESVSGIAKRNGSWSVTIEVVEVHRIPDSTDILASYEVVLDDDGDLIRLERQGRYRRSHVEEDR